MKYFLVPLIIGWFLGAASGLLFMRASSDGPWMHHGNRGHMRERFARELHLSPEQRVKVDAIIEDSHQKVNAVFEQNKAPLEAIRLSTRTQVRVLLNPEQQAQFDKLDAKMAARFKKRFEEGPPGHP